MTNPQDGNSVTIGHYSLVERARPPQNPPQHRRPYQWTPPSHWIACRSSVAIWPKELQVRAPLCHSSALSPRRKSLKSCISLIWVVGSILSWRRGIRRRGVHSLSCPPSIECNLLRSLVELFMKYSRLKSSSEEKPTKEPYLEGDLLSPYKLACSKDWLVLLMTLQICVLHFQIIDDLCPFLFYWPSHCCSSRVSPKPLWTCCVSLRVYWLSWRWAHYPKYVEYTFVSANPDHKRRTTGKSSHL